MNVLLGFHQPHHSVQPNGVAHDGTPPTPFPLFLCTSFFSYQERFSCCLPVRDHPLHRGDQYMGRVSRCTFSFPCLQRYFNVRLPQQQGYGFVARLPSLCKVAHPSNGRTSYCRRKVVFERLSKLTNAHTAHGEPRNLHSGGAQWVHLMLKTSCRESWRKLVMFQFSQ
jgi:hypothetical protein